MARTDWLKRPFAHRGLHCRARGIIENTGPAIEAAMAEDFAVEVDLRAARCGTPMVFHDATLDRLSEAVGPVIERLASELSAIRLKGSSAGIMTLQELLRMVSGRVPLLLELKSSWSDNEAFTRAILYTLAAYRGPVAVMSFDPRLMESIAHQAPGLIRGLVAERFDAPRHHSRLTRWQRAALRHLLGSAFVRPHFIAYNVDHLPATAPTFARHALGLPLLAWTVRSEAQKARARRYADAPIFERPCRPADPRGGEASPSP